MSENVTGWAGGRAVLTLLAVLGLTVALGIAARSLRIDSSPVSLLPLDAERSYADRRWQEFGHNQRIAIGVLAADAFSPSTLAKIDDLSARLWRLPGVAAVISPTTLLQLEVQDGRLRMAPLMRRLPETPEQAAALRAAILAHPLAGHTVVGTDGNTVAITLRLDRETRDGDRWRDLDEQIRQLIAQFSGPESSTLSGFPVAALQVGRAMKEDTRTLTVTALLVIAGVALWAFRNVYGVIVPLATVVIGLVWTAGVMVLTGHAISIATLVVLPLVALLGIAYPLLIVARYNHERLSGRPAAAAVATAMAGVWLPVATTTLATLVGASTFLFSPLPALRDFGACTSIGVVSMLLASMSVVPAGLTLWPAPGRVWPPASPTIRLTNWLERLGVFAESRRKVLLALGLLIGIGALWGMSRVQVGTGYFAFFQPRTLQADALTTARLAAPYSLAFIIDDGTPESMRRPEILRALHDLQRFLDQQPGVDVTRSLVDYLQLARCARPPAGAAAVPATQEEVDALLAFDPAHLSEVVNADFSRARLLVGTSLSNHAEVQSLVRQVAVFASPTLRHIGLGHRATFPRGVTVRPTGTLVLLGRAADSLVRDQVDSLGRVVVGLIIIASITFLSLRIGLFCVLLNTAAVIVLFGLMGWAGITLNVVTSPLAALVLAVAVGHTMHYLRAGGSLDSAPDGLAKAIGMVGRPIGLAAIALVCGSVVFATSSFASVRWFGLLLGAAVGTALVVNLVILSTRVLTARIVTVSDLLLTKLGPIEQIPLFAGLRPFQAKIVVLTGHLASAAAGDLITRRGELKSELCVLLNGGADIRSGCGAATVGHVTRGDVIGEMGLVRNEPRSADVVATEDTEYVILDGNFLDRLRRRYPRTAARVFLNLTRILSDRLDRTTARLSAVSTPPNVV